MSSTAQSSSAASPVSGTPVPQFPALFQPPPLGQPAIPPFVPQQFPPRPVFWPFFPPQPVLPASFPQRVLWFDSAGIFLQILNNQFKLGKRDWTDYFTHLFEFIRWVSPFFEGSDFKSVTWKLYENLSILMSNNFDDTYFWYQFFILKNLLMDHYQDLQKISFHCTYQTCGIIEKLYTRRIKTTEKWGHSKNAELFYSKHKEFLGLLEKSCHSKNHDIRNIGALVQTRQSKNWDDPIFNYFRQFFASHIFVFFHTFLQCRFWN